MKYTILFVDDEPSGTEPLRILLEAKGFKCVAKKDMTSAWTYLQQNDVSVVVSDIMMSGGTNFPEIDSVETGFKFVEKLRREMPYISIICLSVIGDQRKIQMLKRQGILYLRKGETPLNTAAKLIVAKATGSHLFGGDA